MYELQVVETVAELRQQVTRARRAGSKIGCVPTMGALHAGHVSLMTAARQQTDYVVATIFVNPTQFGPQEDLAKYPRPWEADVAACRSAGAALIFHPAPAEVYPPGFKTTVQVEGLSTLWEGASRPGHFDGVTTVVLKLLNMVQPDVCFFGRKDFQQQLIIRRMCRDLNWPYEIAVCPTIREADGLALSSRNVYLSAADRQAGLSLSRALFLVRDAFGQGERDIPALERRGRRLLEETPGLKLDYFSIVNSETLQTATDYQPGLTAIVAAKVGTTRLIDNIALDDQQS